MFEDIIEMSHLFWIACRAAPNERETQQKINIKWPVPCWHMNKFHYCLIKLSFICPLLCIVLFKPNLEYKEDDEEGQFNDDNEFVNLLPNANKSNNTEIQFVVVSSSLN